MDNLKLNIGKETFDLLPEKAVYWKSQQMIIIADAHFGKVVHFRNHGYAVSPGVAGENFEKISELLECYEPQKVLFLGDIFHSKHNREWDFLVEMISQHMKSTEFILVQGNHDMLNQNFYIRSGFQPAGESYILPPVVFSHYPMEEDEIKEGMLNFAGHIHPGVRLSGLAKQHTRLPCFYFKNNRQLILPAFGVFTGIYKIEPQRNDRVFAVFDGGLREVPVL